MINSLVVAEPHQQEELIALLDIPDTPKALYNVLSVVLRLAKVDGFECFPYETMKKLEPLCLSLRRAIESCPEHHRILLCASGTGFKIPLQGLLTKAPLYSLLFFATQGSAGATLRRLQQAGLVMWMSPKVSAEKRKDILYRYQFAIRAMLESKLGRESLGRINPAELSSLRDVRKSFLDIEKNIGEFARYEKNLDFQDRQLGKDISKLARKAILAIEAVADPGTVATPSTKRVRKFSRGRSWSVRGPQQLGEENWIQCCVPAAGDSLNPEHPIHLVWQEQRDADELSELETLDMEPAELEVQQGCLLSNGDTVPIYAIEFKNRIRMRGMAQRIETHNQFLPFSLAQFNQGELNDLFRCLGDVSTDKKFGLEKVLVAVMFATSSWFGRARNLRLVTPGERLLRGEPEVLYFNVSSATWLIPALSLDYRTLTEESAESSSRSVRCDFVEIPDWFGFEGIMRRVVPKEGKTAPFKNAKNLESRTKRFLKSISSRHTLERVERSLLYKAAGRYEPVQASYLFGNLINSASARTFYTSLSLKYYREIYASICQDVLQALSLGAPAPIVTEEHEENFLGARYCPKADALKQVFDEIGEKVELSRAHVGVIEGAWIEFHNWYTVFCSVIQAVLIGARGIREPLLPPAKITPDGIAIFRDKDTADQFHTRSIKLHPLAWELTKRYERHRRRVLVRLALVNHGTFALLAAEKSPWSFLLDPQAGLVEVRPSTISNYLQEATNLPFNSCRKYLRTRLVELDVSPDAIDALLGHASFGEQVWGKFSSIGSLELYREQKQGLDSIIQELALRPCSGLSS